ncbi:hypothetical protein E1B28_002444 [Marasmius oreades]|uniref:Dicer-like protein 1 n=1 Tax=Marasmius oreades TaxID=181124 RepID=A0A9P7ULR6_9AGAR|nr:uncharacterized protein E1B28_002444 [Marasmius oreades]KAG7086495.1 hypothetical protein E1B28_002444 [Marasmius oreades]
MSAPDELVPRQYQEEIFVQAQEGNVIAALGTGSGKTFISILLIKWIATREVSRGKAIIFLVPKVPLVEQQGEFIAKHTTLRVVRLHGASAHELTDRASWEKLFSKNDVFVMTAQIFLNLITHSLWTIDKVSLLVFDECHHARKNHPYNGIMREYMLVSEENRPKIFGLTASPIQNAKNPISSLNELQTNMNARVIGVLDNVAELAKHSPKPVEVISEYSLPSEQYQYPSPWLYDYLNVFDLGTLNVLSSSWVEIERRYHATMANLGPYCASLYLFLEIKRSILALGQPQVHKDVDNDLIVPQITADQEIPSEIVCIADILSEFECFFSSIDDGSVPITIPIQWFTPKVNVLVEILKSHYSMTEFQGIIFVEQRQVAACLAKVLPRIKELEGLVRCGEVVGNNADANDMAKVMGSGSHSGTVKLFREGALNLLIATSVAEEGLDFPACDLVIRFDPLQHMVGYVQSRGRARNKISKFIIMLPAGDSVSLARYRAFTSAESELTNLYTYLALAESPSAEEPEDVMDDEPLDPEDLAERERFVVPTTSAFVNYDNAISLIEHLCSLIPHDIYTPPHQPVYTGDFQATLDLPTSLPLTANDLSYEGPMKRSKKEAKRAVAFTAVKRLYELEVFDEYLLPVSSTDAKESGVEGHVVDAKKLPIMLDVLVKDPWTIGDNLWVHPVHHDGVLVAGLVTGTRLYPTTVQHVNGEFGIGPGCVMAFPDDENSDEEPFRWMMEEYTKLSLFLQVTTATLSGRPSAYLIPVTVDLKPEYDVMRRLLSFPRGHLDWTGIKEEHYQRLLVRSINQPGRTLVLHNIRDDLTPMSSPSPGSPEAASPTYHEYYTNRWTRKKKNEVTMWKPFVPTEGPMIEVTRRVLSSSGVYRLDGQGSNSKQSRKEETQLIPQGCCPWFDIPQTISLAYQALPVLCQRITDVYRARESRWGIGLPTIQDDLLIQALTIPNAGASFNNQRLETLGDAVLELCTTVHFFNKFPHKHEGQLSSLRQQYINNRFLCGRALIVGLEGYLTSEKRRQNRVWRYVEGGDGYDEEEDGRNSRRRAKRSFPRRSLQDCMEAILGAAFLTGGIPMALDAGVSLGLSFGGLLPWYQRYGRVLESPVSHLFTKLEERLGYEFRNGQLLKEAVTHPSFSSFSDTGTYQRLEFLGDAVLDLVVIHYLYNKFPNASSHQLAFPRTKAVCAPALASLAVRCLGVHKFMLANNVALNLAISQYVPHLERASAEIIVRDGWRYDPPKALSDVFESIIGAVLVDSGWNYEKTAVIVETLMGEILELLSPSVCRDPVTILTEWLGSVKCLQKVQFSRGNRDGREGTEVHLHGVLIAGPIVSNSPAVAKNMAAERAFSILQDGNDERSLGKICDCHSHRPQAIVVAEQPTQGIQECC